MGGPVRASQYYVRVHLRLSVPEGDVADQRKQFHLFVENAGWIVLFRLPVEPTQLRVRKSADGFEATSPKPCPLANCCSTLAISSPVSKIRTKVFGSSSICLYRMTSPLPKTVSDPEKTRKEVRIYYFKAGSISVRSAAGSRRFCTAIGSTVTITSSAGDTYAARIWPARVVPSGLPTTMWVWIMGFP